MLSPHNYRYNPKTCKYEPVSASARSIVAYCLSVLVTGALLCCGLIVLYDGFTKTPDEIKLRRENQVLDEHQILLKNKLSEVEGTLLKLKNSDHSLHQKLFETYPEVSPSHADKKKILMADASDFSNIFQKVNIKSIETHEVSLATNAEFSAINISKDYVKVLNSMPTLQPIANPNLELLVSGFGIRINPFHKGKYKHPGIDFAAPRGTDIFASAPGNVIDINKSVLQAGYGNSIDIDHGNGFVTRYAHLEEIKVREGQHVTKGMVIGNVGNSGGSIAPHLHYEVIHNGDNVDPMYYMIEGLSSYEYNKLMSFSKKQNQSLD